MSTSTPLTKKQQTKQDSCAELVQRLGDGHYQVKGKYLNNDTYLTFLHLDCGKQFSATLGQFKTGKRCPDCES